MYELGYSLGLEVTVFELQHKMTTVHIHRQVLVPRMFPCRFDCPADHIQLSHPRLAYS
jgi:hypothetical protein